MTECTPCQMTCPLTNVWPGQICPIPGSNGGTPPHPANCCFNSNNSCYNQDPKNPSNFSCGVNTCEEKYTNRVATCDSNGNILSCKPGFEIDPNYDRNRLETACQVTQNYNDIMSKFVGYKLVATDDMGGGSDIHKNIIANSYTEGSNGICADFKNLLLAQGLDMSFGIDPSVGTVRCSGFLSGRSIQGPGYINTINVGFENTDGNTSIKSYYNDQQKNNLLWNFVANTWGTSPEINVITKPGYTYKSLGGQ